MDSTTCKFITTKFYERFGVGLVGTTLPDVSDLANEIASAMQTSSDTQRLQELYI